MNYQDIEERPPKGERFRFQTSDLIILAAKFPVTVGLSIRQGEVAAPYMFDVFVIFAIFFGATDILLWLLTMLALSHHGINSVWKRWGIYLGASALLTVMWMSHTFFVI